MASSYCATGLGPQELRFGSWLFYAAVVILQASKNSGVKLLTPLEPEDAVSPLAYSAWVGSNIGDRS